MVLFFLESKALPSICTMCLFEYNALCEVKQHSIGFAYFSLPQYQHTAYDEFCLNNKEVRSTLKISHRRALNPIFNRRHIE